MFAVAITLVVLISAAVLLYQFWAGSLLLDDSEAVRDGARDGAPEAAGMMPGTLPSRRHLHIDNAA